MGKLQGKSMTNEAIGKCRTSQLGRFVFESHPWPVDAGGAGIVFPTVSVQE